MSIMNQYGVSPNLGTLNAILEDISTMSVNKNSKKTALSVLAEFKTMGIEPSLASYYFLLRIFCLDRKFMFACFFNSLISISKTIFNVDSFKI